MKGIMDSLNSGSVQQQKKKKMMALVISLTSILLAVALLALIVSAIVYRVQLKRAPVDDGSSDSGSGVRMPAGYTTTTFSENQDKIGDLIWVDEINPINVEPEVTLIANDAKRPKDSGGRYLYIVNGTQTFSATQDTIDAFNRMFKDFYEQADQESMFQSLNISAAYTASADAIYRSGRTLRLDYYVNERDLESIEKNEAYQWIFEHAYEYGFIQLYPSASGSTSTGADANEQSRGNIFRYVGVTHSTYIHNQNQKKVYTLSDYLNDLKSYTPSKSLSISVSGVSYRVYYIAGGEGSTHIVPERFTYTVSGDNMGGYIVVVNTSSNTKK